jgi:hypothetical protein
MIAEKRERDLDEDQEFGKIAGVAADVPAAAGQ